jgi:hypothetical protein
MSRNNDDGVFKVKPHTISVMGYLYSLGEKNE